jgi:hypothetical protein
MRAILRGASIDRYRESTLNLTLNLAQFTIAA